MPTPDRNTLAFGPAKLDDLELYRRVKDLESNEGPTGQDGLAGPMGPMGPTGIPGVPGSSSIFYPVPQFPDQWYSVSGLGARAGIINTYFNGTPYTNSGGTYTWEVYFMKFIATASATFNGIGVTFVTYPTVSRHGVVLDSTIVSPHFAIYYDEGGKPGALMDDYAGKGFFGQSVQFIDFVSSGLTDFGSPDKPQLRGSGSVQSFEFPDAGVYWVAVWMNTYLLFDGGPEYQGVPATMPSWVFYLTNPSGEIYKAPVGGGVDPYLLDPSTSYNELAAKGGAYMLTVSQTVPARVPPAGAETQMTPPSHAGNAVPVGSGPQILLRRGPV